MKCTRSRTGFALPAVLLALVIMALLSTGALFSSQQEMASSTASRGAVEAFYVAERGMAEVVSGWDASIYASLAAWSDTTLTGTTPEGSWSVRVTKATDRLFYLDAAGSAAYGGAQSYNRRVGSVVRISTADLEPRAALTTRNNASIRGNAEVHGEDESPLTWQAAGMCTGGLEDKPGIMIDDATGVGTTGQGEVTGNPAVVEDPSIGSSTFTQFGDLAWDELTAMATRVYAGGSINQLFPQYYGDGSCNFGHPNNWGEPLDPTDTCGSYFPIIHVTGDARMQSGSRGQGILLVDGDLDLRGGFLFHGIVIVQGNFETQGSGNRIFGAVMANNADFENQSLVGGSVVQWSSCSVDRTMANIASLSQVRPLTSRSWLDVSAVVNGS